MNRRRLATIGLVILFASSLGQADDDRRREFIENLFRNIIESQRGNRPPGIDPPVQPRPQVPNFGQPETAQPGQSPSRELNQYRSLIGSHTDEVNKLTNHLSQLASSNPSLRGYLPDLYSIRTQSLRLRQNAARVDHLPSVAGEVQALDTSWRNLSFRLRSDPSMDQACRQASQTIDRLGGQLCELFGVRADFDRSRAVFLAGQAAGHIETVLDILRHDLPYRPETEQLIREGRQVMGLANQLGRDVSSRTLDEAVERCREWGQSWDVYSARLLAYNQPRLNRAIGRVRQSQADLYNLTRIERPLDCDYLHHLTTQLQSAVETLFDRLSVGSLGRLQRNRVNELFEAERLLQQELRRFGASLASNPNPDDVARGFLSLESAWNRCDAHLGTLTGQVASDRAMVQEHLDEIRQLLPVSGSTHGGLTLTRAATLEGLATALYTSLAQQSGFINAPAYRNRVFLQTQQFLQQCSILHAQLANGAEPTGLRQTCHSLVDAWQTCSATLEELPSRGMPLQAYRSVSRARSQVDPAVAEIAVMFGQ